MNRAFLKECDEIISFLKKEGFNVFHGNLDHSSKSEIGWSEPGKWRDFFVVAKSEGIKTIIVSTRSFKPIEDLPLNKLLNLFSAYTGEYETVCFSWFKDSIRYSLCKRDRPLTTSGRNFDDVSNKKCEEKVVNAMVEFMENESPASDVNDILTFSISLWLIKERTSETIDPKTMFLIHRLESKARQKINEKKRMEEKKIIQKLADACTRWCKVNNITRLTKEKLRLFLFDRDKELRISSKEILYQKVNLQLHD